MRHLLHILPLAATLLLATPAAVYADAAPAPTLSVDRSVFKDFKLPQATIDNATSQKLVFGGNNKLQNGAQKQAYGLYFDALAVALDPTAKNSNGGLVLDTLVEQIHNLVAAGHEPNAGAGLNGWTHHAVAQAFLLAKATPEVWSKLSDDDKNRMDWIMKAMAVAASFQFDDGNDYHTSLNADDNTAKQWNPNHRLYLICMLCAAAYFGPDQLNDTLTNFSYDDFMKKFDELGFTNIKATWSSYDWKPILENGGPYTSKKSGKQMGTGTGVKHAFTYNKIPLSDIAGIYAALAAYNYGEPVTNGVEGKSYILNNAQSPFLGQQGMFHELNSHDAEGIRSDLDYCDEDFCSYTTMLMTLKVIGQWPSNDTTKNLEKLMYVGNEDFLFKNDTGFHSFSHGKGRDNAKLSEGKWTGFNDVRAFWDGYLKNAIKPAGTP